MGPRQRDPPHRPPPQQRNQTETLAGGSQVHLRACRDHTGWLHAVRGPGCGQMRDGRQAGWLPYHAGALQRGLRELRRGDGKTQSQPPPEAYYSRMQDTELTDRFNGLSNGLGELSKDSTAFYQDVKKE